MSTSTTLKVPKQLHEVVLHVHPEGRVVGCFFTNSQSSIYPHGEIPTDILNVDTPFVVIRREDPKELRFYNKGSIVRVECAAQRPMDIEGLRPLSCRLHMMDGTLIHGCIRRHLHPDFARLSDYLNLCTERFVELYLEDHKLWLVNKSYIVYVTPLDEHGRPCTS